MNATPFERSYWVLPGRFLAGFYPGSPEPEEEETKLKGLLDVGVEVVIDLMEPDETDHFGRPFVPYRETMTRLAQNIGRRVEFIRRPIRDLTAPSPEYMVQILDDLDRALEKGRGVYVHCWGGRGRTGSVVGCFLVRRGLAGPDDVLDEIARLRAKGRGMIGRSPETVNQFDLVRSWAPGR